MFDLYGLLEIIDLIHCKFFTKIHTGEAVQMGKKFFRCLRSDLPRMRAVH
jgi:hypothetical protein